MALFCILCRDNPGVLDKRLALRPEHLVYLKSQIDIIRLCGPQLDLEGKSCGSLFVIEVDDLAAAQAFSDGDPFTQHGLFAQVDIRGFTPSMGSWAP
jgi:uncharacterized protein YciI